MYNSTSEAKKRIVTNISTNIIAVFVGAAISLWLTPYLLHHLGVEVYGMIPLVISFITYFNLLTSAISSSVSRFVAICLNKGEEVKSNIYFNTALIALVILCVILVIPLIIISVYFSNIFKVPVGFETDTSWLFFLIISSSFIIAIKSPFLVSTFVTHRFDLSNYVRIAERLLRAISIVLCFKYLSVSLKYVGFSYLAMSVFVLVCSIALTGYLTPQLKIRCKLFDWRKFCEMGQMSTWIATNQVGALLYLNTSFIVINLFLGPEQCGRYALVALWVTLLGTLGGAISNIFAPIALEYISRERSDILVVQLRRSTKYMGLIMGLPVGFLCGLSTPILKRWIGEEFAGLDTLVWLLISPWLITIAIKPMFSIFRGLDKVKIPALITLFGGLVNVILSLVLVCFTDLGIHGVALALLICIVAKNLFFTPIYAALITNQPKGVFVKEILPGIVMTLLTASVGFSASRLYDLADIPHLLVTGITITMIYVLICYTFVMNKKDRGLLWSLICRKNA